MSRRATLALVGGAVAAAGIYESLCDPLGRPSLTQIGEQHPELAGALVGALAAHFAASFIRYTLRTP